MCETNLLKRLRALQYSAGGLRDFTRIAASDPIMWRDIFIDNSENILKVLDSFSKNLDEMKKAIQKIKDFVKPVPMKTQQRRQEEREVAGEETSEVAKDYLESLK